jgi:ubiquitin carboxyl-terminal hydrolase L5
VSTIFRPWWYCRLTESYRSVVNRRIATHPEGEVHFNLLAITSRSTYLAQQLVTLEAELVQKTAEDKGTDWTMQQIGEVKERLGRVEEQFKTWDVSTITQDED